MQDRCAHNLLDADSMTHYCDMEILIDEIVYYPELCGPENCEFYRRCTIRRHEEQTTEMNH